MTAPERIWATEDAANFGQDRFHTTRQMSGLTEYIRADLVQEIVAEAVKAEREACAMVADMSADWHADGADNALNPTQKHGNELMKEASASIAAAIRARGEG